MATYISITALAISAMNFFFSNIREKRELYAVYDVERRDPANSFTMLPDHLNVSVALMNYGNQTEVIIEAYINFRSDRGEVMVVGDAAGPLTLKPGEAQVFVLKKSQTYLGPAGASGTFDTDVEVVFRYVGRSNAIEAITLPVRHIKTTFEGGAIKKWEIPPSNYAASMRIISYDSLQLPLLIVSPFRWLWRITKH